MKPLKIFAVLFYGVIEIISAQEIIDSATIYSEKILLKNVVVQMEATQAMNDLYNFKFDRAANQFRWFQEKFPEHPLPDFLLALNEWWKIMPNPDNKQYDEAFLNYLDKSIEKAYKIYRKDRENIDASFFLAASYAFKSRLHSDRKHWSRAVFAAKNALNYLRRGEKLAELSPELLMGEGLYNYYSVWIPKNYPLLRPVLLFFKKGDPKKGLQQLDEAARNAFYTRIEAQNFLMRIYRNEESAPEKAYPIAQYLSQTFPDNAYFHRYYASTAFSQGLFAQAETASLQILQKITTNQVGYEAVSGRYAAFFLGRIYQFRSQHSQAEQYYQQAVQYAESAKAFESGYYHAALVELADYAYTQKKYGIAKSHYAKVKKYAKRKSENFKQAKKRMKEVRNKGVED
jgi:tetratricopeptide (TPR) repeat protein